MSDNRVDYLPASLIQRVDGEWFAAHPGAEQFVRELLPGEFEEHLWPAAPGKQWTADVRASRDPVTRQVLMRWRTPVQATGVETRSAGP